MSHTPTPWSRNIKPASKYPTIWSGRNTHVAYVKVGGGLSETEIEANMELIVKAVNSYQAMKEALEAIVARIDGVYDNPSLIKQGLLSERMSIDVLCYAKKALTLANGEDKEP